MKRFATAIVFGGMLAAVPAAAQQTHGSHGTQGGGHQHGAQQQAGGHEHCEKHAARHGQGEHAAHGQQAHGQQAHGGMMEQHRTAPKMLLKQRDMLQLTAAQVEQLEALQAAHKADCEKRMAAVKAAEEAAAAALSQATPDLTAYGARLREAANHKVDCKVDMARISQAGAALLTAQQRAHLSHMQHGAPGSHSH